MKSQVYTTSEYSDDDGNTCDNINYAYYMTKPQTTHRRFLEVNQHEVVVRAAADQLVAVRDELLRHRRRVLDHLHSNKCASRRGVGGGGDRTKIQQMKAKLTERAEKL